MTRFTLAPNNRTIYRLYAISIHGGTMLGGHYTANVKHQDRWFSCSDSHISPTTIANVSRSQAYLLFYERI